MYLETALTAIKVVDIPAITDASVLNAVKNNDLFIKRSINRIKRPWSHHRYYV